MTNETSAIPIGFWVLEPLKIIFSMRSLRSVPAFCSPNTQRIASTTLLLPHPFGPTTPVIPGMNSKTAFFAKDLKPKIFNFSKYTTSPGK